MAKAKKNTTTPPAQHLVQTETFIDGRATRRRRHDADSGYQRSRVRSKLRSLFPDSIPSVEELSNTELELRVRAAFTSDSSLRGLGIPHRKTILRAAGRISPKK